MVRFLTLKQVRDIIPLGFSNCNRDFVQSPGLFRPGLSQFCASAAGMCRSSRHRQRTKSTELMDQVRG